MKNKIVVFTNLKGGVGKTQLCATAATYFVYCDIPVIVIDADIQQSLSRHRKRDLEAPNTGDIPWDCIFLNTTDTAKVKAMMERAKKLPYCILIDCPGNINDQALQIIYEAADIAVVPFELNADSVDATHIFAKLFKKNFSAKMFFVPNKVSNLFWKRGTVRKAREDAMELLDNKLGVVTPDIKLTTHLNGYSTMEMPTYEVRQLVFPAFKTFMKPIWRFFNKNEK